MKKNILIKIIFLIGIFFANIFSQTGTRVGTTSAAFLELGFSTVGNAMGETQSFIDPDISSVYYNPASLGYLEKSEIQATYLPWILDIESSFVIGGYVHPVYGSFAFSFLQTSYGDEKVRTISSQDGTGEIFDGQDLSVALSYGRRLTSWFSFGTTFKYVSSQIWHMNASAVALDLGAIVNTSFFSWTGNTGDGLNIGMSISNYGTRMQFEGLDARDILDPEPDENGNYAFVPVNYETNQWELPLIARIGVSAFPIIIDNHRIMIATDFLHANNNSEFVNFGSQYEFDSPAFGKLFLRGGYKGLFMEDSEFGLTLGFGVHLHYLGNNTIKFDYSFRDVGVLGGMHTYTLGLQL